MASENDEIAKLFFVFKVEAGKEPAVLKALRAELEENSAARKMPLRVKPKWTGGNIDDSLFRCLPNTFPETSKTSGSTWEKRCHLGLQS